MTLCWNLWFIWSRVLFVVIIIDIFAFFDMQLSSLTSNIWWRWWIFSSVYFWFLYQRISRYMDLCFGIQIVNMSVFVPIPWYFLSLYLCSTTKNWEWYTCSSYFFYSGLFSIGRQKGLLKTVLEFWWGLQWILFDKMTIYLFLIQTNNHIRSFHLFYIFFSFFLQWLEFLSYQS